MWHNLRSAGSSLGAVLLCLGPAVVAQAAKDQTRIDDFSRTVPAIKENTGLPGLSPGHDPDLQFRKMPEGSSDEPTDSIGGMHDFPLIETIDLTPDLARKALDALYEVKDKYESKGLEEYETLEEFVAEAKAGKQLDADIRRHGFKNVTAWNTAIMTIEFAYSALNSDYDEIEAEIEAVRASSNMSERERKEVLSGLEAMLSTPNNKAIVQGLLNDPVYVNKLKILDTME